MSVLLSHQPWLVALSVLLAIQGSYVGLNLALQVEGAYGARRRMLLAAASITLAVAIWSMHFVGMLAVRLPFEVDYLVFPTLLSFLVSVLAVGVSVYAVTAGPLTRAHLAAAAVFMGLGIVSMHYIGMLALHASAHLTHSPLFAAASVAIAIAASGLGLRLAAGTRVRPPMFLSAAALGIAISGMHYTAMAGVAIHPLAHPRIFAPALSHDLLAILVAVVAFVISGLFLLILVPEQPERPGRMPAAQPQPAAALSGPEPAQLEGEAAPSPEAQALSKRTAIHLPVERDRAIYMLPVERIVAVRANAHYTYVFDGSATYFCSLPIGDVEARLDAERFARVHRSHIINMDRIVALTSTGDNGRIELDGENAYFVPVSRSRITWVKAQLGLKVQHAAS